ncbi:hypothetical protein PINS_up015006 [Pythium insidiosum]|nr:hypothetical protein PINS_up015006 [Pythium insidiosum]
MLRATLRYVAHPPKQSLCSASPAPSVLTAVAVVSALCSWPRVSPAVRQQATAQCPGASRCGLVGTTARPSSRARATLLQRALLSTAAPAAPPGDEDEKKAPTTSKLEEVKRLMRLYAPEKKPLAVSMSALAVSTAVSMCVPFGMGKIIDVVTAADGAAHLPTVAGGLAGLFVVGSIANVIRVDVTNMIGERITNRLRQSTYESIMKQDLGFFDASRTGELVNRLSADTTLIGKVLSDNVSQGLRSTGQALGSVTMLFITCPKLGFVMLSIVPPIAIGAVSYGRFVKKLTAQVQTRLSEATEIAEEKLANIRVVRWFAKENHEVEVHRSKVDEVLELARKRSLASATFFGGVDFSVKMSMLAVLGYGGQMVADGVLTSGQLTSFLMYTLYVGFSFAGMSSFYSDLMKGIGASTRIFELLAREPKVRNAQRGVSLPAHVTGRIQFQDVHFCYPTRPDSAIFRGLNLDVKPNETIALVGPSGCGKSSVIGLLARFYELDGEGCSGRILLDDVDVSTLELSELRGIIGAVRFAGCCAHSFVTTLLACVGL